MSFIGFAVLAFALTFLTQLLTGLGLMDGKKRAHGDAYYTKRCFYSVAILIALAGLFFYGLLAALGAAAGALGTWFILVRQQQ